MTGLHVEDGRVTGVQVTRDGQPALIRASRGVVLAAGGFERNEQMRQRYQRQPIGTEWTTGAAGNTGDAITAGEAAGAALDLMDDAWWGPSIPLAGAARTSASPSAACPAASWSTAAGQRFVNESAPYVDAVHAMYDGHTEGTPHIPAWLITDQRYRDSYVFAGRPPRKPLPRRWYAAGAVYRAPTVAELAGQVGWTRRPWPRRWPGSTSSRSRARTRTSAAATRPTTATTATRGSGPTRASRRCGRPPFYAVKIVPGDLGTKGGLRTDERARVLRADGTPIAGLYAAGNTSAAVMGHSYAGAGATIGPR